MGDAASEEGKTDNRLCRFILCKILSRPGKLSPGDVRPMLDQCWPDVRPTLIQHLNEFLVFVISVNWGDLFIG